MVELLLACCVVGALIHAVYFALAPLIWNWGGKYPIEKFTPWTRSYALERDGLEVYALYIAVFIQGALLIGLVKIFNLINIKFWKIFLLLASTIIATEYLSAVGFHIPMSEFSGRQWPTATRQTLNVLIGMTLIGMCFYLVRNRPTLTNLVAAVLLIPVCFISTGPPYLPDYGYIFAPALQILNGTGLSEIYLQYDLLLTLVAALTLHSNNAVELLQTVGQASFYSLFFGVFFLSKKLFYDKRLSVFLLTCIALVRVYAGEHNILTSFQVTPLRLDLWFIVLLTVYLRGASHWFAGLTLGLLIFFHRNFGIIYFAAYCQLIALMFYLDFHDSKNNETSKYFQFRELASKYFLKYRINLTLTFTAFLSTAIFLGGNDAYRYQNIGIGFLRIASESFFWHVSLLLSVTLFLLIYLRNNVSRQYFTTGCFLVILATGNSLYFFGRSHENNIINISVIYIFALFLFIDLVQIQLSDQTNAKCKIVPALSTILGSLVIIFCICIAYAKNIDNKTMRQILNFSSGQFVYPNPFSKSIMDENIANIRSVTGTSKKLYFVSSIDYLYYFHGNYRPIGYYNPFLSWVFQDEMVNFVNYLIGNDYFVVIDNIQLVQEALPLLKFRNSVGNGKYFILWK